MNAASSAAAASKQLSALIIILSFFPFSDHYKHNDTSVK
jgi:hypothetical protein